MTPLDDRDSSHMSKKETCAMLQMCQKLEAGATADLPAWLQEITERGTSKPCKLTIIQKWVMNNNYYYNADESLILHLLKIIMKRLWISKEININGPYLIHKMEGLSPFSILNLSEDEVA